MCVRVGFQLIFQIINCICADTRSGINKEKNFFPFRSADALREEIKKEEETFFHNPMMIFVIVVIAFVLTHEEKVFKIQIDPKRRRKKNK
jgi:hypothetical protein